MMLPLVLSLSLANVGASDVLWGDIAFGMYPTGGEKVAPNGLEYKPMFRLVADVNVGSRDLYMFANSAYYTEKPQPGVTTNKSQGSFDFTKRQYDFNIGGAIEVVQDVETRFWAYSQSNINRGTDQEKPSGYKDGFVGAVRSYFDEHSHVTGYYSAGYYFTKELIDTGGQGYEPSFFGEVSASSPVGYGFHAFTHMLAIGKRGTGVHEFESQAGMSYHMRGGSKTHVDLFFEADTSREGDVQKRVLLEFSRNFQGN